MIDVDNINVGDTFYRVSSVQILYRNKITKVIDGRLWHSYDEPRKEYRIDEIKIIGKMIPTYLGIWEEYIKLSVNFNCLINDDESRIEELDTHDFKDDVYGSFCFYTREEAEEHIRKCIESEF